MYITGEPLNSLYHYSYYHHTHLWQTQSTAPKFWDTAFSRQRFCKIIRFVAWCNNINTKITGGLLQINKAPCSYRKILAPLYISHDDLIKYWGRDRDRHNFADDIFKGIFLNENVWISLKISMKFVPKVPINIIPALVQIMVWRRPDDKPLSEPMTVSLLTRHSASLS